MLRTGALKPDQPMKYSIEDFETKLIEEAEEEEA